MVETPSIVVLKERNAAIIRLTIPRPQMESLFAPAVRELTSALLAQGVSPTGALFAHHLRMDPGQFDVEIGLPTDGMVVAAGRVTPGRSPGGRIARAIHQGGYEGLGAAWSALRRWMEENGLRRAPDLWEVYRVGPETSPDPANWRTELNQPVLG